MEFDLLEKTPLFEVLSDLGKRMYLPDGIFFWSGRAKKEAEYNATIGVAYAFEKDFIETNSSRWVSCYLKFINDYFKNLDVNELVSYASIPGLEELRNIWKRWIILKSRYDSFSEKEKLIRLERYTTLPIITAGVTNAIYMVSAMFLNSSEAIICPNKRWGNYDNIFVRQLKCRIHSFEFFKGNKLNIEGLKETIYKVANIQNKIIIFLGFPNNPTGFIPTWQEQIDLVNILKEIQKEINKTILIFIDDAYEPYIFSDKVVNRSLFYDLHQLDENIIPFKLDGITKELLMYGGRIGFVTIGLKPKWLNNEVDLELLCKQIENKLSGFNRSTISNCNHFYQAVAIKVFKEQGIDNLIKTRNTIKNVLKLRFDKVNSELKNIKNPNISVDPNGGGFFVFLNLESKKIRATEFADHLLKKYKVGVIPFENQREHVNGIRIAYCSIDINQIPEMIERINLALDDFN